MHFLAYIDGATGSFVLQAAAGLFLGGSYLVRRQVKLLVTKFKKRPQAAELHQD